jgi:glycosyltransferase involved in cell wall biosynthesis
LDTLKDSSHRSRLKQLGKKCNLIISIAQNMTSVFTDLLGIPNNKIFTSFWGYDSKIFFKTDVINDNNIIKVINPRGFESVYNWKTLVESIPIIIKTNPNYKFIFTNGGTEKNCAIRLINKYKINKYVEIYERLSPEKLAAEYNKSHIFVSLSLSDGNLISLNEAMACGLFPICSNTTASRQWIVDNKNGYLLKNNYDAKELAKKILSFNKEGEFEKFAIEYNCKLVSRTADFYDKMKIIEEQIKQIL